MWEEIAQWFQGLWVCRFERGLPQSGLREFGECVRGPSHCDEDHSAFSEGHLHDCIESKFTGDSTRSTQPESHN